MSHHLTQKIIKGPIFEGLVDANIEDEEMVCAMIHETLPQLEVTAVKSVKNSFLEAMYLLKKEEYKSRYKKTPQEKLLFHITAASNVNSIISNNFDWRRITRGKFGLGTSFSGDAEYANRYANYNIGRNRAIIVSKVLICNQTNGVYGMKVPPRNYDTTTGNNNKVYVKFNDNEVLPKYILWFTTDPSWINKSFDNKKKHNMTIRSNLRTHSSIYPSTSVRHTHGMLPEQKRLPATSITNAITNNPYTRSNRATGFSAGPSVERSRTTSANKTISLAYSERPGAERLKNASVSSNIHVFNKERVPVHHPAPQQLAGTLTYDASSDSHSGSMSINVSPPEQSRTSIDDISLIGSNQTGATIVNTKVKKCLWFLLVILGVCMCVFIVNSFRHTRF